MIFVSAQNGNDANGGTLDAPVRQISTAVGLAAAGDTVLVRDSGDYNPFNITQSIAVVAEGAQRCPGEFRDQHRSGHRVLRI